MTKMMFKDMIERWVRDFDVYSCIDNITEDMTQEEIDADLWINCPLCGEPILWGDVANDKEWQEALMNDTCPVCEEYIYED